MTERAKIIDEFIERSAWNTWARFPIASDASSRKYERLTNKDQSVILMDDPNRDTIRFADIALELHRLQLHPPEILEHVPELGIMVLSDLGNENFATWLQKRPTEAPVLYRSAADILLHLQNKELGVELTTLTPFVGGQMITVTTDFYLGEAAPELCLAVENAFSEYASTPNTLSLRDFHAENLIWRPAGSALSRVGLLDFQDAFIAPEGYDLMSLLRDARRDVAPNLVEDIISYFIDRSGNKSELRAQLACLGAQRNLRILGVFARLASEHGKIRYLDLLPRVWRNLQLDLLHPALDELRHVVNDILQPPSTNIAEVTEA